MNKTIQLYTDKEQTIKGYPITTADRVFCENGESVSSQLDTIVLEKIPNNNEIARSLLSPTLKEKKPVFTFIVDDGVKTHYTKLLPIVKEKSFPLGIALITGSMGQSHMMTWEEIKEFTDLGCEMLSHTHNHVDLTTITDEQIHQECKLSQQVLREHGYDGLGLVYPYNSNSVKVRKIIRQYFHYAFGRYVGGADGINYPTLSNYIIGRTSLGAYFDTPNDLFINKDTSSLAYYKERVDDAIKNNAWLVFVLHTDDEFDAVQQQHLRDTVDYIRSLGHDILSPREAFLTVGNIKEIGDFRDGVYQITDCEGRENSYDMGIFIENANVRKSNDRITTFPQHRITYTPITSANANGFPGNVGGILKTYNIGSTPQYRYQEYEQITDSGNGKRIYRRCVDDNYNWLEWLDYDENIFYAGICNFNVSELITSKYYKKGKIQYNILLNSDAVTYGFPEETGGILKTFNLDNTYSLRYQEYQLNGHQSSSKKLYRRYVNVDNTWTEWVCMTGNTLLFTKTTDAINIPANSTVTLNITGLTGADAENNKDMFSVTTTTFPPAGVVWSAIFASNNAISIRIANVTSVQISLPTLTWNIRVTK